MKHTFDCGHTGKGQSCHRCAQENQRRDMERRAEEALAADKREFKASFEQDVIDLRGFPNEIVIRTREMLTQVAAKASIASLSGQRLNWNRNMISIPIGKHYRLICEDRNGQIVPKKLLSHEDYNAAHPGR